MQKKWLEQLEYFFATSIDLMCILDQNGLFKIINPTFLQTLGYTQEELLETPYTDLLHPDDLKITQGEIQKLTDGNSNLIIENRYKKKDGSYCWLSWKFSKKENLVYATATDITHMKAIQKEQERLEMSEKSARLASQFKSEFLASMSHEIRTPLNGIIGITNLLAATPLTSLQRDYTNTISESSQHLQSILNNILDLSKIEANKIEIDHVTFDLKQLLNSVERLMKNSAEQKGIHLRFNLEGVQSKFVKGDPLRIRQILINLIQNAIKYSEEGTIEVHTQTSIHSQNQYFLEFQVKDSGIGIDPALSEKIFRPYQQGSNQSKNNELSGVGLGLSICKRLVELMHGSIGVTSSLGHGAKFFFKIPIEIASKTVEKNQFEITTDESKTKNPKLILVAEDNPINQKVVQQMLQLCGHNTVLASNGTEAIKELQMNPVDLVLMDCHMPLMDGFTATTTIRQLNSLKKNVPIIALTADVLPETRKKCFEVGMNAFLSKPINIHSLFSAIEDYNFCTSETNESTQKPIVIDHGVLNKLNILNDKNSFSFTIEIISDFLRRAPVQLQEIEKNLQTHDFLEASEKAHTLKSVSAIVGASHFSALMSTIEKCARTKDESALKILKEAYADFEQTQKALLSHISELKSL